MSPRVLDPPLAELDQLANPLTEGERRVVEFFNEHLPAEWEMYIQPFLNGLRPDLVLLNPAVGIAVFEVKDWNLEGDRYRVQGANGEQRLGVQTGHGEGPKTIRTSDDPVAKVQLYEREILDLYCPRLEDQFGRSASQAVSAGIIFTKADGHEAKSLLEPLLSSGMQKYSQYYPISGRDDLELGRLSKVFPEASRPSSNVMSESAAEDLRGWLREPSFSQEQRTPLRLDGDQERIATSRTGTGYRRVKGAAGSGKTAALAARAVERASEGGRVLVCTYNITLMNYIRDLTRQYARTAGVKNPPIEFLNFHHWCKRTCQVAGRGASYADLWSTRSRDEVWEEALAALVDEVWRQDSVKSALPKYDAILVDEGQDFRLSWWSALRAARAEEGEMLLLADKTQNIYGTAGVWTDQSMRDAGFSGPWLELKCSYRLPPVLVPFLRSYADQFLPKEETDIPVEEQADLDLFPVSMKWIQTTAQNAVDGCAYAVRSQLGSLTAGVAAADTTILCGTPIGLALMDRFDQQNLHAVHTFDNKKVFGRDRRLKLAFFRGDARIKATTLHSFKGWEAARLVIYVDSVADEKDRAVFYAALTRIQRRELGSALTVVCSTPDLAEYGRTWPTFEEFPDNERMSFDA